ncbi:type II toxin-antitoxin system RelE/ParE family toxin [Pinirhizobacter sp.]|jgi:hypothetical protein|uniref:type II toxin-antitoxin system RelE/ParE family toxin n=1 Tax=Pinirhizobacter sp. TaxID=2950432 RepID=UPI002F4140C4
MVGHHHHAPALSFASLAILTIGQGYHPVLQFVPGKKGSGQKIVAKKAAPKAPAKIAVVKKRTFKTAWFAKNAPKAGIKDADLCAAIKEVVQGQCSDLGGGVFKKRLKKNEYRSIVLAKGGNYWIFAYLFAKNDRGNIDANELDDFRKLAKSFAKASSKEIGKLIQNQKLMEICHEHQAQVQY